MISLTYGIQNTTQMNISSRQKQTHQAREKSRGKGGGEGKGWEFGVSGHSYYM